VLVPHAVHNGEGVHDIANEPDLAGRQDLKPMGEWAGPVLEDGWVICRSQSSRVLDGVAQPVSRTRPLRGGEVTCRAARKRQLAVSSIDMLTLTEYPVG
jgi:hypothetical protein